MPLEDVSDNIVTACREIIKILQKVSDEENMTLETKHDNISAAVVLAQFVHGNSYGMLQWVSHEFDNKAKLEQLLVSKLTPREKN